MSRRGVRILTAAAVSQVWERVTLVCVAGCTGTGVGGFVVGGVGRRSEGGRLMLAAGVTSGASSHLPCHGGRRERIGGVAGDTGETGGEGTGAAQEGRATASMQVGRPRQDRPVESGRLRGVLFVGVGRLPVHRHNRLQGAARDAVPGAGELGRGGVSAREAVRERAVVTAVKYGVLVAAGRAFVGVGAVVQGANIPRTDHATLEGALFGQVLDPHRVHTVVVRGEVARSC